MNVILARIGKHPTVAFAAAELARYLKQVDETLFVEERVYDTVEPTLPHALWLGLDGSVPYSADHDGYVIALTEGMGKITGANERSVLMAAYRLLQEIGCRFLHPGKSGEIVPKRKLDGAALTVSVAERPSYRHRAICIEGAVAYEHVKNTVDWLPKVGMNGYFVQFKTPLCFFERFYNQTCNPAMPTSPVTAADVDRIMARVEEDISLRSLDYHAMGHGWTCEPFGIAGTGWNTDHSELPAEITKHLALVGGKRALFGGVALNTNLCYSNKETRQRIVDAVSEYCKSHPRVNFLHFWLADGANNHCECENCVKARPSDFYVKLLNEVDARLTAEGITTRLVCLLYRDLLWAPEKERFRNPDRFVLMFAPIARTYSNAFADLDASEKVEIPSFERNKLPGLRSVAVNLAMLRDWQSVLPGDSFDFDYHLMWDHDIDPGYMECARILHADMAGLEKIGLDGMVSCQLQRAAFPTGLPQYAMAKALWNKNSRFEDVVEEYFSAAFGRDAKDVVAYLSTLSALFDPPRMRAEREKDHDGVRRDCAEVRRVVSAFREAQSLSYDESNAARRYLAYHADLVLSLAGWQEALLGGGTPEELARAKAELINTVHRIEPYTHEVFDAHLYKDTHFRRYFKRHSV